MLSIESVSTLRKNKYCGLAYQTFVWHQVLLKRVAVAPHHILPWKSCEKCRPNLMKLQFIYVFELDNFVYYTKPFSSAQLQHTYRDLLDQITGS